MLRMPSPLQFVFVILGICCIIAAGNLLEPINEQRVEHRLTDNDIVDNAPPQLALASAALGGLKGVLINYLWIQAEFAREERRNYEIVQLYDWISKLEPRIPHVWEFTAWEMVYNISVTTYTVEERWRWIWKGLEHLRNYGLKYNKNAPRLYWRVAFIFLDKMGMGSYDEYRTGYQNKLIELMEPLIGPERNVQELANAPLVRKDLMIKSGMEEYIDEFQKHNIDIFKVYANRSSLTKKQQQIIKELMLAPQYREQQKQLSAYIRSHILRTVWRMEPEKMLAIEKKYAALDWRLPAAHCLYWAEEGTKCYDRLGVDKSFFRLRNMDRLRNMALQQIFEYGFIIGKRKDGLVCIPNLDIIDAIHQTFLEIEERWEVEEGRISHETFLRHAIWQSYLYGRIPVAKKYYKILREKFIHPSYKKDLDKYVITEVGRKIRGMGRRHIIENYINSTLLQAYEALLNSSKVGPLGEDLEEKGKGFMQFAKLVHKIYMQKHGNLEHIEEENKPRPFIYFERSASSIIKKQIIQRYGAEKGEKIWKSLMASTGFLKPPLPEKNIKKGKE